MHIGGQLSKLTPVTPPPISKSTKDYPIPDLYKFNRKIPSRDPAIQLIRDRLPVCHEEQSIVEAIKYHPVVIVSGETGSGKTTQIPQFLYECGMTESTEVEGQKRMIGVTEPRRVAAMAMSNRVGQELNLPKSVVSYQIRYETNRTDDTELLFMTDGVLLKEIKSDFLLTKYSVIIIDEAHERSVHSDILIGLLSRIVAYRWKKEDPLRLVIMSATLRINDFLDNESLFGKSSPVFKLKLCKFHRDLAAQEKRQNTDATTNTSTDTKKRIKTSKQLKINRSDLSLPYLPVINVKARQFDVKKYHLKKTPSENDYLSVAIQKAGKIHTTLPPGDILIFVATSNECNYVCKRLKEIFPFDTYEEEEPENPPNEKDEKHSRPLKKVDLDSYKDDFSKNIRNEENDSDDEFSTRPIKSWNESPEDFEEEDNNLDSAGLELNKNMPLIALPIYSKLASERQKLIFKEEAEDSTCKRPRRVIVATNVAETSITIPKISYVIDTGKINRKVHDLISGVSKFEISWISQASAEQRAGRSGRVSTGYCYRMYSSAVFANDFEQFDMPEICRRPVLDVVLYMKGLDIPKVANFPFPSAPGRDSLVKAEVILMNLGAIERERLCISSNDANVSLSAKITPLGRLMNKFPVDPRYSKMLARSNQQNILPYIIALVSVLTVKDIWLNENDLPKQTLITKKSVTKKLSSTATFEHLGDLVVLLGLVGSCTQLKGDKQLKNFCDKVGLRFKAVSEVLKQMKQIERIVGKVLGLDVVPNSSSECLPQMNLKQADLLSQTVISSFGDQVALKTETESRPQLGTGAKKPSHNKVPYSTMTLQDNATIHHSSLYSNKAWATSPTFICYNEISQTSFSEKMHLRGIISIKNPSILANLNGNLCDFSEPVFDELDEKSWPYYDEGSDKIFCRVKASYGKKSWNLGLVLGVVLG